MTICIAENFGMIASVKKICPKLYPIDGDMSKQWFLKFQIPTHNGQSKKPVKIYIAKLASSTARLEAANKIIADIQKNGYEVGAKKPKVGFSAQMQMLYGLLETRRVMWSRKTYCQYKGQLDKLNRFCIEKNVTVMNDEHANAFLESLILRGLNPTTVNACRITMRGFYATLKKRKQVYQNPFLETVKLREHRQGAKYFQVNQQTVLKIHIKQFYPELWLPIQYLYYCFIRPAEMARLTVADVSLGEGTINIPADKSKNKKNQFVVIPGPLLTQMFEMGIQDYPPNYFLVGKDGLPSVKPLPINYLGDRHRKLTKQLKFPPKYSLYSWKHTGVVMAYKSGIGLRDLQMQLRHHSLEMVAVYMRSLGISDLPDLKDKFPEL